jgi:hypothetical protein
MTGFPCTYCLANIATRQGLASHIAQSKACRQRHHEAYEAASDSEQASESGSDTEIGDGTAGLAGDADDDTDIRDGDGAQYEDTDHAYDSDGIADLPEIEPPVDNSNARKRPRATVEEVEDEDDRWTQDFPEEQYAGATFAECQTEFEQLREQQKAAGLPPWAPFETQKEWDLARWLIGEVKDLTKTDSETDSDADSGTDSDLRIGAESETTLTTPILNIDSSPLLNQF